MDIDSRDMFHEILMTIYLRFSPEVYRENSVAFDKLAKAIEVEQMEYDRKK